MRFRGFVISLCTLLFAMQTVAQPASPQLQAAIEAWLADDDAAALPAISALAAAGDAQASLLLGQIERDTPEEAVSDWVNGLSAADRAKIFRPGGAQQTEALAANGDALAEAIIAAASPETVGIETAHLLHAFGEVERARFLAWSMLEAGKLAEVITMPAEEPLFRDLDWLWWMRGWMAGGSQSAQPLQWVLVSEAKGRAAGIIMANWSAQFIAAKTPLTPELKRVSGVLSGKPASLMKAPPEEFAYAEKMIAGLARRDPAMRALGAVCKRGCSAELGACMMEGLRIVGGYGALMPLDTPYEALISQTDYTTSARAANTLERLLRASAPNARGTPVNECLMSSIAG